jgi:hypothetical protein
MSKRTLGITVLAVLVVLDLVLIALALRPPPAAEPVAMPIAPPLEASAPEVAGEEATAAAPSQDFPAPGPARLVAVRQDGSALAVQTGSCAESNSSGLEIPSSGAPRTVTVPGSVMGRLVTADDGSQDLVATSSECYGALRFTEAEVPDEWTSQGSPQGTAYMFPGGTAIELQAGPVPHPCDVKSFSPGGQQPTVLCSDGSVLVSSESTWQPRGNLTAGLAISHIANGTGSVGLATAADCTGLTVNRSDDGGAAWSRTGCIPAAAATGEPVGIGAQGTTVVVVDGAGRAYRGNINGGDFTQGG